MSSDPLNDLPTGWRWNWVFPPMKGSAHPNKWCANAVKFLGQSKLEHMDNGDFMVYRCTECFATGGTKEEAVKSVITKIMDGDTAKRWIHFTSYDYGEGFCDTASALSAHRFDAMKDDGVFQGGNL